MLRKLTFVLTGLLAATMAVAEPMDFSHQVFGPLIVEGNTSTSTALILKETLFQAGDSFDFDLVDMTWEHLEDLGWFAFVDISLENEEADAVTVTITVEEDRTLRYYPIIDYDQRWDILLGARVYDINFGGRGETISLTGVWHQPHRYDFSWDHPWLFGIRGLKVGIDATWEDAEFVYRDFDHRRWSTGSWLRWNLTQPAYLQVGATRSSFEQGGDFAAQINWAADTRQRWTYAATAGFDSRDMAAYPTRGRHHRVTLQHHQSDDFPSYSSMTVDLREYVPLPWKHILAIGAWGRQVDGHTPPEDLLFWGGPENLRGHHYASFEGEEGWLLSVEYRWPLFLMPISADGRVVGLGLHAFYDRGGNAYMNDTVTVRDDFGLGAHINLSAHQFRFEVARTDDDRTVFQFMDTFNF